MKKKLFYLTGIILFVGFIFIVIFYLFLKRGENRDEIVIYGNVDIRQVDLGFRVFGKVKKLFFDEGDLVKKGDLLALLDKVPYEEKVLRAKAAVEESRFALKKAEAQFQKRDEVEKDAISKEDFDDSFFNLEEKTAQFDRSRANLSTALTNLGDTALFSPTEGTILTRIREPGSVLNAGEPVFTLSIKAPVWIRIYVSEPDLGRIYFGMMADISTDSGTRYKGHIGFISPVAEFTPKNVESTDLRTDLVYRLRVIVDDPDKQIKQGMPVTVKLKINK
jgi:HlyD family secretion protein